MGGRAGGGPERLSTSMAAAMTLGLEKGRFQRGAELGCLNLLQNYDEGCRSNCTYCGMARERHTPPDGRTFIRVPWPVYPVDLLLERARTVQDRVRRVCVGMVTHPRALEDALATIRRFREGTDMLISALVTASLFRNRADVEALLEAGADRGTVALDAATPELFERHRGRLSGSPHTWDHSWRVVSWCAEVFGRGNAGVHLIVGLGETEEEMIGTIQRAHDLGAMTHLFSFYPEAGSALQELQPPPLGQYRRVQVARHLINEGMARAEGMRFDARGRVVDFGADIEPLLRSGEPFRTSGCPDESGEVACNRPYGNERPGDASLRNYPFAPEAADLEAIRAELRQGLDGAAEGVGDVGRPA